MNINTTQALYLIKLIDVLRELGKPVNEMLAAANISAVEIADRENSIPIAKYLRAVEEAVTRFDIPDLGFRVGAHTRTLEHGVVGYAILSSATIKEGLQRYERYQLLLGPLLKIRFDYDHQGARLIALPLAKEWQLSDAALRYFVQEWLITWRDWAQMIDGADKLFNHVKLGFAHHQSSEIYKQYLGCNVSFGNAATEASIPLKYLDLSVECGNKTIGALCHVQCEGLLENLKNRDGLTAEIQKYMSSAPGELPTMEQMADTLCMSSRTLRRRLQAEGVTYQKLVSDYRINMAKHYLQETSMPANGIAELIGYANAPNFYRAFFKETGQTPQEYRVNANKVIARFSKSPCTSISRTSFSRPTEVSR